MSTVSSPAPAIFLLIKASDNASLSITCPRAVLIIILLDFISSNLSLLIKCFVLSFKGACSVTISLFDINSSSST